MKKILVIQTAFIGDAILATSLVESIYDALDGCCEITLVVRKGNATLFENNPKVKDVFVWDKKGGKYRNLFQLIKTLRNKRFDAVYNLQRFASTGFITWRMRASLKVGYAENPFSFCFSRKYKHLLDGRHEVERNFELVRADLPDGSKVKNPRLYPNEADQIKVAERIDLNQKFIVLAPASVWFTKQWPFHKWVELIKNAGLERVVYLIGGPSDKEMIDQLIEKSGNQKAINMAGEFSLTQSAYLMQFAERVFVNDSAPLHLASAVNAPVTAFFCSTVPSFGFGPLSKESIIAETKEKLECRPCGLHGHKTCPKGHFKCAETIEVPILP